MRYLLLKVLFLISTFLFAAIDNFTIKEKIGDKTVIALSVGDLSIENNDIFHSIISNTDGKTQDVGEPELPTYTFNYAIELDKNYEVQLEIGAYTLYENINLIPTQPLYKVDEEKVFIKNEDAYKVDSFYYPVSKISSKRMSLRGYELLNVEVSPFEYNPKSKVLKVYNNPEIIINESGTRMHNNQAPRSYVFEEMYKNYVINSDDYQDSRNFQKPSILYICGGSVSTSPYLETLTEWRHKQGYVVNVVSTSETGSSTTNIKNYIQNAYNNWENPPEHVCLIGDANGSVSVSTYTVYGGNGWSTAQGEGDFPYSLLEGDDFLPEVFVGRMSIRSTSELITVINKIIGYEKNYANDTTWLNAMALVGDPYDSGISTVISNEYIEVIAAIHGGITDVRTKYSGNNFDEFMRNQINDGVAYLNYRGFYGFSNFNSNDVNQLNNGYKLPFLATLTCGTGSFASETTCMTEELYRAGTSVTPKGAVAVIGTAQSYTHTAFNNIIDMGIFEGIFINGAKTVGEAVAYGKLAMNEIYPQNPGDNVYLFSTWNNLLGDPALQLWTSSPETMIVQHDQMLINGSNNLQVYITSQQGSPLEDIIVTLSRTDDTDDEVFMTVNTNVNGIADFSLPSVISPGEVFVTSRAQNYIPDESSFTISNDLPEVVLNEDSIVLSDSAGNNDGILNPGESVYISMQIVNNYSGDITNLYAEITTNSNFISLTNNLDLNLGDLLAHGTINLGGINVSAANTMSNTDDPMLRLKVFSNSDDLLWNYVIPIDFSSAELDISYDLDSALNVGESTNITLSVENLGSMELNSVVAEVNYNGSLLSFDDNTFLFTSINSGLTTSSNNSLVISADNTVINGSVIAVPLIITSDEGYQHNTVISIQVGSVTINDPVGPDSHGYYIYDIGDTQYELAPEYDWVEIDTNYGGDGDELDLNDGGNNQDDVTTISLPFAFTFYGIVYNSVSICSNGWISFGETDMESFRNYTLPGPGGPSPIVAVFWDDLKTTSGGDVFSYYDQNNDLFIIEWSDMRTYFSNSSESFQVILYNTGDETPTGDDEMKLQYKDFNNTSVGDYPVGNYDGAVVHGQYCTVGIENHLANDGLQYTFNNSYATGARTLNDQSALFITTRGSIPFATPDASYNQNEFIFNLPTNSEEFEQLIITNDGELGSILEYEIKSAPYPVHSDQIDLFGYAWMQSENNDIVGYDWIDISDDNSLLEFEDNDTAVEINMGFYFPFYTNNYSQCLINPMVG